MATKRQKVTRLPVPGAGRGGCAPTQPRPVPNETSARIKSSHEPVLISQPWLVRSNVAERAMNRGTATPMEMIERASRIRNNIRALLDMARRLAKKRGVGLAGVLGPGAMPIAKTTAARPKSIQLRRGGTPSPLWAIRSSSASFSPRNASPNATNPSTQPQPVRSCINLLIKDCPVGSSGRHSAVKLGEALAVDLSACGSAGSSSAEGAGVMDEDGLEPEAGRNMRGEGAFGIRTDLPTGAGRKAGLHEL